MEADTREVVGASSSTGRDSIGRYAPERYIERLGAAEGTERPIRPEELLVGSHRDAHPVDIHAGFMTSRAVRATGSVGLALERRQRMRDLAWRISAAIAGALGRRNPDRIARWLFGLEPETYFRFQRAEQPPADLRSRLAAVRARAGSALEKARAAGGLRLLLTGGTGFLGQELVARAIRQPSVAELIVLIRPREIRDRRSGELLDTLWPAERGRRLLERLGAEAELEKVRFLAGDIERPALGLGAAEIDTLARRVTHVVHCAASVAFDAPYEASFRANVEGSRRVLELSETLRAAEGSPFVAHLSIETSYIHGRQVFDRAREDRMVFPRNYYNNYYELTKAMASLEAERALFERGLPVVQLCPSIVIGEEKTGNNRGDTKVVNAPVNLFGRAHEALEAAAGGWLSRSKAALLARLACVFPGDPSAEINMIPVDWVVSGILAALDRPAAVGERVHLVNDRRLSAALIARILHEELGVRVQLAEPTLHRNVGLPLVARILAWIRLEGLARAMRRMNDVFGGYSEWGQPVHEVGNDVRLLGLPAERPDPERAFRMLCRHNRWVQEFGRIRDRDEITRREAFWREILDELEERTGRPAGSLDARTFQAEIERTWPSLC